MPVDRLHKFALGIQSSILIITLGTTLPPATAATKAHKPKAHGAIAIDRQSDAWGYGVNQKTSREARLEALRQCNRPGCEIVMRIEGECGAVARRRLPPGAYDAKAKFSTFRGTNREESETKALRLCGPGCEVVAWACNR